MSVDITLNKVKSDLFLGIDNTSYDTSLQYLIDEIIRQAIDYIDEPDTITSATTLPKVVEKALMKQIAYEWRRRKDLGLSSQQFPDGGVNKWEVGEWLSQVEAVLIRHRRVSI